MKRTIITLSVLLVLAIELGVTAVRAEPRNGREIFESMKCTKCHHPEKKVNGPALTTIVKAYENRENLLKFFRGETDPIVEPERYITMKPRRRKIGKLSEEEKKALADYFFGFQQ